MTTAADSHVYLSRLILDTRSRQVWSELAHPYEMHRTLMRAFPNAAQTEEANARNRFDVLFRADEDSRGGHAILYVQSAVKPNWSFLASLDGYLLASTDLPNPASKDVTSKYSNLKTGQKLSFCLRANPTKRIAKPDDGHDELKGKRVGLLREEDQIAWMIQKGKEREKGKCGGFKILMREWVDQSGNIQKVPHVAVQPEGKQKGRKKDNGHCFLMTHVGVRFEGILEITDADAFRETLARGIGPGKAFGFGLLSIAPVK